MLISCDNGSVKPSILEQEDISSVNSSLQEGDIIFQSSFSGESIEKVTKSKFSHCGLVFLEGNQYYVLEAIQPISITPLQTWIDRGIDKKYTVQRLKDRNALLNDSIVQLMKKIGRSYLNKPYDTAFLWSDDEIYCSELVWKVYQKGTGLQIGKLEKLKDFDLSSKELQPELETRWGNEIPYNETVISPQSIYESDLLETVLEK